MERLARKGERMKFSSPGICGFVGSGGGSVARTARGPGHLGHRQPDASGLGNQPRAAAEAGREVHPGRHSPGQRLRNLPAADWVIDAAANRRACWRACGQRQQPAVVRAQSGQPGERAGVLQGAPRGLLLLRSSRVYSIPALKSLPLKHTADAFYLDCYGRLPAGVSARGIGVDFSTAPRFPCTAARNWPAKRWRSNMARRSNFRCGSTAAACWPGRGSSARRSRGFSPIGSTPTCASGRCATSASTAPANRCATRFPSARSGGAARSADAPGTHRRAADLHRRRRPGERHVAGAIHRLVRCAFGPHARWLPIRNEAVRHSVDGDGQVRTASVISAGSRTRRSRRCSKRSRCHAEANPDWLERSGL
jgi:hypothetical protein